MADEAEAARLKEERRAKRRNRWGNAEEVRPHKPAVEEPRLDPCCSGVRAVHGSPAFAGESGQGEAKKKKSRWELTDPGITEQVQLKLRLDDIQRKLSLADCGVSKEDPRERCVRPCSLGTLAATRWNEPRCMPAIRSPSPAPEYDSLGNRINTREKRTRGKLMEERNGIIEKYQVSFCLPERARASMGPLY